MSAPLEHMQIAPYFWYDGELARKEDVSVDPFAHGLHYGSGVFEGIRAYATPRGPAVFRLREHMERFQRSAAVYGLDVSYSVEHLCAATLDALGANGLASAYVRPLAFFGERTIALAPRFHCPTHVLIAMRALGNYFRPDQDQGIRATISPWRKFSSSALPATVKGCGHYANSVLAMQDAVARGFDEAILLNDRGDVAEGTGENVFVVRNGVVFTNDADADVLPGITRASVIELARERGLRVEIGRLRVDDLFGADEVFFTGTAVEVTRVAAIDGHVFGPSFPITGALRAAYAAAVGGRDPAARGWLTYVDPEATRLAS